MQWTTFFNFDLKLFFTFTCSGVSNYTLLLIVELGGRSLEFFIGRACLIYVAFDVDFALLFMRKRALIAVFVPRTRLLLPV